MKTRGIVSILLVLFLAGAQANNYDNTVSKGKHDTKRYVKYVISPLMEFSSDIAYGTLHFQMSVFKNKGEKPHIYNCTLEFSRWPNVASALPSIVLTIGDTLLYVTDRDSLYVFDLTTKKQTVGDFKAALNFICENQFISFYAYYYSLSGKAENVSVVKEKQFVSSEFEFYPNSENGNGNKGYHQFVYQPATNLLSKYIYEPSTGSDFERIECELIDFQRSISPSALREWVALMK